MNITDIKQAFAGGQDIVPSYEGADGGIEIPKKRFGQVGVAESVLDDSVATLEAMYAIPARDPQRVSEATTAELEAMVAPAYEPAPAVAYDPNSAQGRADAARELANSAHLQRQATVAAASNQPELDLLRRQREQTRFNNG